MRMPDVIGFRAGRHLTSEGRRAARRARRDAKRAAAKARRNDGATFENAASTDALMRAAHGAASGIMWKSSTQRYMAHALRNTRRTGEDMLNGIDLRRGFVEFDVRERGKVRHISAVHFSERVVQKSVCQVALGPCIWPTIAPGCSANVKGRGVDYALIRLKRQLARHWRRHGSNGWVLLIDFTNYFGSIDHNAAMDLIRRNVDDPRIAAYMQTHVDSYGDVGLGLGSEPNQIIAVALPSPVDRLLESWPEVEASGRYMDDSYAISCSRSALWSLLHAVESECDRLGITINKKKTRIVRLSRGFCFLKKRFRYSGTGHIVVRPCRDSLSRQRRRMRKHAAMVEAGTMPVDDAWQSYLSWRGSLVKKHGDGKERFRMDVHDTVRSFDGLAVSLFGRRQSDTRK